ncbi:MAG: hypothetical protein BWY59_01921 [Verrucomicrobia bacterium ADurb.Bin345]|nr:MAG: hypothetical protein BWY59_01921 [Verrucomicrobia bacterium ADurb.Bin345]
MVVADAIVAAAPADKGAVDTGVRVIRGVAADHVGRIGLAVEPQHDRVVGAQMQGLFIRGSDKMRPGRRALIAVRPPEHVARHVRRLQGIADRNQLLARRHLRAVDQDLDPDFGGRQGAGQRAADRVVADERGIQAVHDGDLVRVFVEQGAGRGVIVQLKGQRDGPVHEVGSVQEPALVVDERRHLGAYCQDHAQHNDRHVGCPHAQPLLVLLRGKKSLMDVPAIINAIHA